MSARVAARKAAEAAAADEMGEKSSSESESAYTADSEGEATLAQILPEERDSEQEGEEVEKVVKWKRRRGAMWGLVEWAARREDGTPFPRNGCRREIWARNGWRWADNYKT